MSQRMRRLAVRWRGTPGLLVTPVAAVLGLASCVPEPVQAPSTLTPAELPQPAASPEVEARRLGPPVPVSASDSRGHTIRFPFGAASFADEVVEYRAGTPVPVPEGRAARAALGAPDYAGGEIRADAAPPAVSLGNGGSLTLRFTDNALVDVEGPDLYVFEVGPSVESARVEVSVDGTTWVLLGTVGGRTAGLDLAGKSEPDAEYHWVRITDDDTQGEARGDWPGADIDAVGAIGALRRVALPSEVLFDHDSAELLPGAAAVLDAQAARLGTDATMSVRVEGHTDATGTAEYNQGLSQRRAEAVAAYLVAHGVGAARVQAVGFGPSRPVAANDSDEHRRANRRVELVVRSAAAPPR